MDLQYIDDLKGGLVVYQGIDLSRTPAPLPIVNFVKHSGPIS